MYKIYWVFIFFCAVVSASLLSNDILHQESGSNEQTARLFELLKTGGSKRAIQRLFDGSLQPNLCATDQDEHLPPVLWAVRCEHYDAFKILITKDRNALSDAQLISRDYKEQDLQSGLMSMLVRSEVNLNLPDSSGHTPVMIAAKLGQENAVQTLKEAKADLDIKNYHDGGKTVFSYIEAQKDDTPRRREGKRRLRESLDPDGHSQTTARKRRRLDFEEKDSCSV